MTRRKELEESTSQLYCDILGCIDRLVSSRLDKSRRREELALKEMESLMCSTMQQLTCVLDYLKQEPEVTWQTGIPEEEGEYIFTLNDGSVDTGWYGPEWPEEYIKKNVKAWCRISDIKPCGKEEQPC